MITLFSSHNNLFISLIDLLSWSYSPRLTFHWIRNASRTIFSFLEAVCIWLSFLHSLTRLSSSFTICWKERVKQLQNFKDHDWCMIFLYPVHDIDQLYKCILKSNFFIKKIIIVTDYWSALIEVCFIKEQWLR